MAEAYIIDTVRTPVGKRGGSLSQIHPADLGAHTLKELVKRTDLDAGAVDDVVMGCLDTIGSQAGDVGRTAWIASTRAAGSNDGSTAMDPPASSVPVANRRGAEW